MRYLFIMALLVFAVGCSGVHYGVTPYGQVSDGHGVERQWQAGISVTFFDKFPTTPAVPNNYRSETNITVDNSNSASADADSKSNGCGECKHHHHDDDDD